MIVQMTCDGALSLVDADNFHTLRVIVPEVCRRETDGEIRAGTLKVENGFVVVPKALLAAMAGSNATQEWLANVDRMIERMQGPAHRTDRIGTHVEWTWGSEVALGGPAGVASRPDSTGVWPLEAASESRSR